MKSRGLGDQEQTQINQTAAAAAESAPISAAVLKRAVESKPKPRVGKVKKAVVVGMSSLALTGGAETSGPELPHTPVEYAEAIAQPYASCKIVEVTDDQVRRQVGDAPGLRTIIRVAVQTALTRGAAHTYGKYETNDDVTWSLPAGTGWILAQVGEERKYVRDSRVIGSGQDLSYTDDRKNFPLAPRVDQPDGTRMLLGVHNEAASFDTSGPEQEREMHLRTGETPCGWLELRDGLWQLSDEPLPLELAQPIMPVNKDVLPQPIPQ
jgi:hypothetical protein